MLKHPTLDGLQVLKLTGMVAALTDQMATPDIDELAFEERAHLKGSVTGFELFRTLQHRLAEVEARGNLGTIEWQHQIFACGISSGVERRCLKSGPVETMDVTQGFAGERTIAEADQGHETANGIAEDVAVTVGVGLGSGHGGEEGVAGAEGNDDVAGIGGAHPDQRCRVVTGEERTLAIGAEAVFLHEVVSNGTLRAGCGSGGAKLVAQSGSGGLQ